MSKSSFHVCLMFYKSFSIDNLEVIGANKPPKVGLERCSSTGTLTEFKSPSSVQLLQYDKTEVRHTLINKAFSRTNLNLAKQCFDITFSGTTGVTVMLFGDRLTCANVGDSRAVVGSCKESIIGTQSSTKEAEKTWTVLALSRDHKPDDEDEYKRILAMNGRVEPYREVTGEAVGPPRVWLLNENIPGLAMSRSFGDQMAAKAGVISVPEIYDTKLSNNDKFMIIATDGVWEFISSDAAVEMVIPFWKNGDPEGACDKLIKEAVKNWEQKDEVIDDITAVVIFLADQQK